MTFMLLIHHAFGIDESDLASPVSAGVFGRRLERLQKELDHADRAERGSGQWH